MSLGADFDAVMAAARSGADWAIAVIYRDLDPNLVAYLTARHPAQAEDIASETWMHVASGLDRFQGDERGFRAWVFTIAHRRLVEVLRREKGRTTVPLDDTALSRIVGDAEADAMESMSSKEAISRIASLPPAQAEVVLLRVIADLSVKDVAAIMGRGETAIRSLQLRALRRLARETSREPATP